MDDVSIHTAALQPLADQTQAEGCHARLRKERHELSDHTEIADAYLGDEPVERFMTGFSLFFALRF